MKLIFKQFSSCIQKQYAGNTFTTEQISLERLGNPNVWILINCQKISSFYSFVRNQKRLWMLLMIKKDNVYDDESICCCCLLICLISNDSSNKPHFLEIILFENLSKEIYVIEI